MITDFDGIFTSENFILSTGSTDHVTFIFTSGKSVIIRTILIYCGKVPM